MSEEVERFGPYEVKGELGRGAMARVWRAWDANLEREVAIKEPLFDSRLGQDVLDEMGRRFVKEGKAAAALNHQNIVTIYAADVYDGRPAIVMELVDGATLSEVLDSSGKLAPAEALSVLDQLLDAVGYAHEHGIVHRDIKPDNIFIDEKGRVKLADFGIARVDDDRATRATMMGTVLGTPGYMSPEQAKGSPVDGRSDLFSVGVVGYEMLSGRNPFGAGDGSDSTTLLYRIVHEPAPELPAAVGEGLPSDLRPAIMKALSKDPADRPQTAEDFKSMLHGGVPVQQGTLPEIKIPNSGGGGGKLPKWAPYAIVAAVCLVIVIGVFAAATSSGGGGGVVSSGTSATAQQSGKYYLTINGDGYIAVYAGKIGDGSDPERVTDVKAEDMSGSVVSELKDGIAFDSLDEANAQVKKYREDAEKAAAEKAQAEKAKQNSEATISIEGAGGDVRTAVIHRQGTSERVFPDSNTRRLSTSEVAALSDAERCIAWNEIIAASNGYAFKNGGLAAYFNSCSWYHRDPNASGSGNLSAEGSANVELLKSYTDGWWMNLATY